MLRDSERAVGTAGALIRNSVPTSHSIVMAGSAEGKVASAAKENSHVAAPHALPVNKFVTVLLAECFSVAKLFHGTFSAQ